MKLIEIVQPRKIETNEERELRLSSLREQSIAFLDYEKRRIFLSTILGDNYKRDDPYGTVPETKQTDDFIRSIMKQWLGSGHLSEKQVQAVMRYADKMISAEAISDMLPDLKVNKPFTFIGIAEHIEGNVEVQSAYGISKTNKVTVKTSYGIIISFKTVRDKLLAIVQDSINHKKRLKITGTVIWMTPDKTRISLKASGIKIEYV